MKKKDDGGGEGPVAADPGLSLFWLDGSAYGRMTYTDTTHTGMTHTGRAQTNTDVPASEPCACKQVASATRTLVKTVSWRILATMCTVTMIYVLTSNSNLAATAGVLDATVKMGLYYAHERIWNRVQKGTTYVRE